MIGTSCKGASHDLENHFGTAPLHLHSLSNFGDKFFGKAAGFAVLRVKKADHGEYHRADKVDE